MNFDCRNCNSKPKSNSDNCQCDCKLQIKHRVCEEDDARKPSI